MVGSGKCHFYGEWQMKKRYQIDKQRAVQQFRRLAEQNDQAIQLVIPLKEVLDLVQRGLMNLALRTSTQVAEEVMDQEVTALVGPKNQANPERDKVRWGSERWLLRGGRPEGPAGAAAGGCPDFS
jgi:hypothetical protein